MINLCFPVAQDRDQPTCLCKFILMLTSSLHSSSSFQKITNKWFLITLISSLLVAQRYKSLHKYEYQYEAESLNAINGASHLKNGHKASCKVWETPHDDAKSSVFPFPIHVFQKKKFPSSHRLKLKCLRLVVSLYALLAAGWVKLLTRTHRVTLCLPTAPALMPLLLKWKSM